MEVMATSSHKSKSEAALPAQKLAVPVGVSISLQAFHASLRELSSVHARLTQELLEIPAREAEASQFKLAARQLNPCFPDEIAPELTAWTCGEDTTALAREHEASTDLSMISPHLEKTVISDAAEDDQQGIFSERLQMSQNTSNGITSRMTEAELEEITAMHIDPTHVVKFADNCSGRVVQSTVFVQFCTFLIVASSAFAGLEVELKNDGNVLAFNIMQYLFTAGFTIELLLRVHARGRKFFAGADKLWNIFDSVCVSSSYVDIAYSVIWQDEGAFLVLARTIRVVRIARIVRVIRYLKKLQLMVFTMLGAMKLLGWMVALLVMIIYMFAVCFTEAAKAQLIAGGMSAEGEAGLDKYWGSLPRSSITLFMIITGGISWEVPYDALLHTHLLYNTLLLSYICLVVFTMLNVITGLCTEFAIDSVATDKEHVIQEQLLNMEKLKKEFASLFGSLDADGSGEITVAEFMGMFQDEEFQAYLSHLNISVFSAFDLFCLLDTNDSGSVSVEEFVGGCMRLKGQAKTIDVMKLNKEISDVKHVIRQEFERWNGNGSGPKRVKDGGVTF